MVLALKPTTAKMLAYAKLRGKREEKQHDIVSRQNTVAFYKELRRRAKMNSPEKISLLCRRAFIAAANHCDRVGYMFTTGKFYPGDFIGEGKLYGWDRLKESDAPTT